MTSFRKAVFVALLAGLVFAVPAQTATQRRAPNIVVVLADDLGWDDVGYHGSEIRTPNLDRLAREGVRLERFYAAARCSPTRAGLMTGRYPIHFGLMRGVVLPWDDNGLPKDVLTLPELLGRAGYGTREIIGKWHLGFTKRSYHPLAHGFTEFFGLYNGGEDYYEKTLFDGYDWNRNYASVRVDGYVTDIITDEAVKTIGQEKGDKPFFLYVAYTAPHAPLQAPAEEIAKYADIADEKRRIYAAMVTRLDAGIGKILAALEAKGLARDTLVLFMSDNGGETQAGGRNLPLRGRKGEGYEGGIRVPAVIRWPAGGLSGGKVNQDLMGYIDVLPTLVDAAGGRAPPPVALDGVSQMATLTGRGTAPPRSWYTLSGFGQNEQMSVIDGEWKLVRRGPNVRDGQPGQLELFNLKRDPLEKTDLAPREPQRVANLLARLDGFRSLEPEGGLNRKAVAPGGRTFEGIPAPPDYQPPAVFTVPAK